MQMQSPCLPMPPHPRCYSNQHVLGLWESCALVQLRGNPGYLTKNNKILGEIHWPPLRFTLKTQSTPHILKKTLTSPVRVCSSNGVSIACNITILPSHLHLSRQLLYCPNCSLSRFAPNFGVWFPNLSLCQTQKSNPPRTNYQNQIKASIWVLISSRVCEREKHKNHWFHTNSQYQSFNLGFDFLSLCQNTKTKPIFCGFDFTKIN